MNKFILLLFLVQCTLISCKQNRSKGESAYLKYCANCHGENGEGLVELFPPLTKDRLVSLQNYLPCIIQNGIQKDDSLYSGKYVIPMPANPQLSETDVINLSNYVLKTLAEQNQIQSPLEVEKILQSCQ